MKIVIIGGIAAGMSVAAKARRSDREAEIIVIEKEDYVSFGACGLPYYVGNEFTDKNEMFARTPEQMREAGIKVLTKHKVVNVDFNSKEVSVHDLSTDQKFNESYDRLMIATGAKPILPPIEGINGENVYTITKLPEVEKLKENLPSYKRIVIIGGGFIGVEMADQLVKQGKQVSIVEASDHLMSATFDSEFSIKIEDSLKEEQVAVRTGELAKSFILDSNNNVTEVQTNQGAIQADAVIVAIGFKPNTELFGDGINKMRNGAIVIDEFGQTSVKDVFCAGDCGTVRHRLLGDTYIPLATTANKMGRIIGENIVAAQADMVPYVGALGSSAIKAGQYEAACTGITEKQAKEKGFNYKTTCIETNNHSNYYGKQEKITIKLVYDADTFVLYGAQLFGKNETVLRMTGLSTAIHGGLTTKELGFIDYAYAPPFASTWEAINVAANTAK